ncbi:MAG: Fis family transcriptional regulator [Sphingomonas bacterium]|nr:sigma 54-interacting transcriptional regulator [Sphingomonas bacterium]MDB5689654.1 Fis family transcriptional regulator [Sphingomonas bacterium]
MQQLTVSDKVQDIDPALAPWLAGCGFAVVRIARGAQRAREEVRILAADEIALASHRDILIDISPGPPQFERAAGGMPARLRFGFEDMAFAHAMIAELVRPAGRPACGEPDSARFLALTARIAASDATVLVLGETGTGKEGIARYIHHRSPRAGRDFIAVNCAALPDTMLEAMLFGHQKGSFTGAGSASEGLFRAADGGTLLLDEIAEMPLPLQAKLLRAIQEREVLPVGATRAVPVDVRIIAAANRDLAAEVAAGRFRADLYWRLNVLPLSLRPLGERRLDIRAITAALLLRHTSAGEPFPWPSHAALDALMAHRWPGNVRELENVIQRALLLRAGERLEVEDIAIDSAPAPQPVALPAAPSSLVRPESVTRLADVARTVQAQSIADALAACGGHRARAAMMLGISERTLRYRLANLRAAREELRAA